MHVSFIFLNFRMQSGLEEMVLTGDSRGHYRQKPEKGLGVFAKGFKTLEGGEVGVRSTHTKPCVCVCVHVFVFVSGD